MLRKTILAGCAALAMSLGLGAMALAQEAKPAPTTQPYPLSVCLVSDENLGDMGEPYVIQYEGREVKLCCDHCEADFRKDPKKYMKKLDEAAKKAATTQPAAPKAEHDHSTHKH